MGGGGDLRIIVRRAAGTVNGAEGEESPHRAAATKAGPISVAAPKERRVLIQAGEGFHQGKRIHPGAVETDRPVQMSTRHPAGGSHIADSISRRNHFAFLDGETRKMGKVGIQPLSVIQDHGIARIVEIGDQNHLAPVGGLDQGSLVRIKVGSGVRTARLAVEDAALPETAGGGSRNRRKKGVLPYPVGIHGAEHSGYSSGLPADARHHFIGRIDELLIDREPAGGEFLVLNLEFIALLE